MLFLKELLKKEFCKYCIVGIIGLVLDLSVYYLCYKVIGISYGWSNIISSNVGVINNFILNSLFTFKAKDKVFLRFLSFYGIAFIGMLISTALIVFFTENLNFHPMFAKLVALGIVTILQFLANKFITFRKKMRDNNHE